MWKDFKFTVYLWSEVSITGIILEDRDKKGVVLDWGNPGDLKGGENIKRMAWLDILPVPSPLPQPACSMMSIHQAFSSISPMDHCLKGKSMYPSHSV